MLVDSSDGPGRMGIIGEVRGRGLKENMLEGRGRGLLPGGTLVVDEVSLSSWPKLFLVMGGGVMTSRGTAAHRGIVRHPTEAG